MRLRAQWQRLPLRHTLTAVAALVLVPALGLLLWPRSQAAGLGRLLSQAQLMQSFAAGGTSRPLPALWRQRLGGQAPGLWARQQGTWWQFWGAHGDSGAYLVMPAVSLSGLNRARLPQQPLLVDDLAVIAADALSRQWLAERLRTVSRPQRGLEQRCLEQLRRPQVVVWNPAGLGVLAGPVAPLLQRLQQGCLSLDMRGDALALNGEAAAGSGVLGPPPPSGPDLVNRALPPGQLLELSGPSLEMLLQGLLGRQLVREPLASRYGITEPQLALMRRLPFVLRLRALPRGPFVAGLTLELAPPQRDRAAWLRLLAGLREPLLQQGLQEPPARLEATSPRLGAGLTQASRWTRADGQVVGGWFESRTPGTTDGSRLVLFLGPQPEASAGTAATTALRLRARPADLAALDLWPSGFPQLVRTAPSLELLASDGATQPISRLTGRLSLSRSR